MFFQIGVVDQGKVEQVDVGNDEQIVGIQAKWHSSCKSLLTDF